MEGIQTLMDLSPQFVLKMICKFYPWQEKQLKQYEDLLSWEFISMNKSMFFNENIIEKYYDKWDWMILTDNPNIPWSLNLIEKYKEEWSWESYEFAGNIGLSSNRYLPWSEELIDKYKDKWFWGELSSNPSLPWSLNLIRKHEDLWTWDAHYGHWGLSLNPSPLVKEIMKVYYPERIDQEYFDVKTEVDENKEEDDIIINAILKVFSDNICHAKYILSSLNSKISNLNIS